MIWLFISMTNQWIIWLSHQWLLSIKNVRLSSCAKDELILRTCRHEGATFHYRVDGFFLQPLNNEKKRTPWDKKVEKMNARKTLAAPDTTNQNQSSRMSSQQYLKSGFSSRPIIFHIRIQIWSKFRNTNDPPKTKSFTQRFYLHFLSTIFCRFQNDSFQFKLANERTESIALTDWRHATFSEMQFKRSLRIRITQTSFKTHT